MAKRAGYLIHNMARSVSSKLQRSMTPTRHSMALWVLGRRVLPKRPIMVSVDEFDANERDLINMIREGRIAVTAPDGTFIDSVPSGKLTMATPGEKVQLEGKGAAIQMVLPPSHAPESMKVEEPLLAPIEEPKAEEPPPAPPVEEAKVEEPVLEEPKAEEPVAETPVEEAKMLEEPHYENRKKKHR